MPMEDVSSAAAKDEKQEEKKEKKEAPKELTIFEGKINYFINLSEFKLSLKSISTAIAKRDIKGVATVLKNLRKFRSKFTLQDAEELISLFFSQRRLLGTSIDVNKIPQFNLMQEISKKYKLTTAHREKLLENPEIDTFIMLLYIMKLIDSKEHKQVGDR